MGIGTSAILGSTGKFFMPWFIPRNDNQAVFQPNVLNKLQTGRKRRDLGTSIDDTEIAFREIQRALENISICEDQYLKQCPHINQMPQPSNWFELKKAILCQDCPGENICREDYETCLGEISRMFR